MSEANEFKGILIAGGGSRPVMSKPPEFTAARSFVDRVMVELDIPDRERAERAADWIINFAERFGANSAQGVFNMQGDGPLCSWCGTFWPLCGHHLMSGVKHESEEENE